MKSWRKVHIWELEAIQGRMLGFHNDAILLSGPSGSQLKTAILKDYYEFWWSVTSGGSRAEHAYSTAIVDLNAATGELHIEDTGETVLGSAGHALELKYRSNLPTEKLALVLVEDNEECYRRLKDVIRRRWPEVPVKEAEGPTEQNLCGVYLLNSHLEDALPLIEAIRLGNSIFFFDPLLHVEWDVIERVAESRIRKPLQTGTEFVIFVFTSDWFTGREYESGGRLVPLPASTKSKTWTEEEGESVAAADTLFGDAKWQSKILVNGEQSIRQGRFIDEYRWRLLKWFRWVLPLPFIPKEGQLYHLLLCSNYEAGIRFTRDYFCKYTGNPRYSPGNRTAYERFCQLHPETLTGLSGNQRSVEWKVLWQVIRNCEGGLCDLACTQILRQGALLEVVGAMEWLEDNGYLTPLQGIPSAWSRNPPRLKLDWQIVGLRLEVNPPDELKPVTPQEVHGTC